MFFDPRREGRKQFPKARSAYSDSVSPEEAKETGIREFLMKPLGKQAVGEAVRRALNGKTDVS